MPDDPKFSFQEFGASFKTFLDQVSAQAPAAEAPFAQDCEDTSVSRR